LPPYPFNINNSRICIQAGHTIRGKEKVSCSLQSANLFFFLSIEKLQIEIRAIALMVEAASTSETSVNFYQTTRRNNPEDSHLQIQK
jgi:hypothetical protein